MIIETDLPNYIQYLLIAVQLLAVGLFFYFIWPYLREEKWREKFFENKTARSIIIVFVLIFIFLYGMGIVFDTFFPIERLDQLK
jgi:heme/copper-type cytochrome/quinol oxidase subunit 2